MCDSPYSSMWTDIRRLAAAICLVASLPAAARAEAPLSAIDWLSESVAAPATAPLPQAATGGNVISTVPRAKPIDVTPLDGPTLDGIGILSAARIGLPRDLWGPTPSADIARMIRAERTETLPEIQSLLYALLLAELAPPTDAAGSSDESLFLARVDRLLDLGALDQALALLDRVENPSPEVFRRTFDTALLLGQEDRACTTMTENPQIAPSFPARIFCLARSGDWNAAALSLNTGTALGFLTGEESDLISRFLDPDLYEGEPDLPMPERPTPLVIRMMGAIGQPVPTGTLPVAFAHADLGPTVGLKTRIEAAERLARTGAIPANRLLGLYTEQKPAASGGVWDRAAAIGRLDAAVEAGDAEAAAAALPEAWARMQEVELEVALAEIYGERLQSLGLAGEAGSLAFRIGLLSPAYEKAAQARKPQGGVEPFLIGLSRGKVDDLAPPDQLGGAIKTAFAAGTELGPDFRQLLDEGRLGEAVLKAIDHVTEGARGDIRDVAAGLRLFREVGLETVARRAALELLLLERRG